MNVKFRNEGSWETGPKRMRNKVPEKGEGIKSGMRKPRTTFSWALYGSCMSRSFRAIVVRRDEESV